MAFVFRDQKKPPIRNVNPNPGPGTYNFDIQRENKIPKAYVPFGSMQPKAKQTKYPLHATPGPGTYNIQPQQNGQKIVVSSQTQDIKILEISRPHPVFKSGTDRFNVDYQKIQYPGPGAYNVEKRQLINRAKMLSTNTTAKPKIIQHLININKYQSIPSIPSNVHAYGYNENENQQLQLNQPPFDIYKGQKEDKVGPGHYNPSTAIQQNRVRGVSWSVSKVKKFQENNKANFNVGPGSYDTKTVQPLYNFKPSCEFTSKTLRSLDQRKGAIANKVFEEKAAKTAFQPGDSQMLSQKGNPSTRIDDDSDSDQYEYIEDTTPGPGSYLGLYDSKVSNNFPKKVKQTSFGVKSKRFADGANNKNVGPGSYKNQIQPNFKKSTKKAPQILKGQINRFPALIDDKKGADPGPGSYEPRNTMEDKLIYKIQRGYRGQFGTTEARLKQKEQQQLPGPGYYDSEKQISQKQIQSVFKSKSNRITENKFITPGPGVYTMNQYDIATKVIKQEEEDPDLIIKKPGFGVGQVRFKEETKRVQDFDDDDIIKQIQEKNRQEKRLKNLKNNAIFKSKQPRFKQGVKQNPGPGSYYDGEEDYWNKRTYNILFADI